MELSKIMRISAAGNCAELKRVSTKSQITKRPMLQNVQIKTSNYKTSTATKHIVTKRPITKRPMLQNVQCKKTPNYKTSNA